MDATADPLVHLDEQQCWQKLAAQELGRIVTHLGDRIDIFPINYAVDGRSLVVRTAEGSKLFELTVNDEVLFEVDDHTDADAWSVIVRGRARVIVNADEINAADALPLRPWAPTVKNNYVRIEPSSVSGRAFLRTPEPQRDGIPNL